MATLDVTYTRRSVGDAVGPVIDHIGRLPDRSHSVITAGEANPDFWKEVAPRIADSHRDRECSYSCILGPVVCVDPATHSNPIFELVRIGAAEVLATPYRCAWHARLIGLRAGTSLKVTASTMLFDELPHPPLAGCRYNSEFTASDPFGHRLMTEFMLYVNTLVDLASLQPIRRIDDHFILLTPDQIKRFSDRALEVGLDYGNLDRGQLAKHLVDYGITSEPSVKRFMAGGGAPCPKTCKPAHAKWPLDDTRGYQTFPGDTLIELRRFQQRALLDEFARVDFPDNEHRTLEDLATQQGVRPIGHLEDVLGAGAGLWESEGSFNKFIDDIYARRREDRV
jgi:hypothetical protein